MVGREGISMIVAVKNGEFTIAECIESIRRYAIGDYEIVVVNDNSIDNTSQVLQSLAGNDLVVVHSEKTLGRGAARNLAVSKAKYEWISILDADDLCAKDRFGDLHKVFSGTTAVDVVSGAMAYRTRRGKPGTVERSPENKEHFDRILSVGYMPVPHGGLTIRKSTFLSVGGYRNFDRAQDFDLVIRLRDFKWVFSKVIHYIYRRSLITSFKVFALTEKFREEILQEHGYPTRRRMPLYFRYLVSESKRLLRVWS